MPLLFEQHSNCARSKVLSFLPTDLTVKGSHKPKQTGDPGFKSQRCLGMVLEHHLGVCGFSFRKLNANGCRGAPVQQQPIWFENHPSAASNEGKLQQGAVA